MTQNLLLAMTYQMLPRRIKPGILAVAVASVCLPLFAQDQERSEVERKINPAKLQQLAESRRQAQAEISESEKDQQQPEIMRALEEGGSVAIAIVQIESFTQGEQGAYQLNLAVKQTLRGALPDHFLMPSYWHEGHWIMRPPWGWDRIRPEKGKLVLTGVKVEQNRNTDFGVLDLGNPNEAAGLPLVKEFLQIEERAKTQGFQPYLDSLENPTRFIQDFSFQSLTRSADCAGSQACQQRMFAAIRNHLRSPRAFERMDAVNWLRIVSDEIQLQKKAKKTATFDGAAVREMLQSALSDKNLLVGDEAFSCLSALDFANGDNAGYCLEIVPALRFTERYPKGEQRIIGGSLNASSICRYRSD